MTAALDRHSGQLDELSKRFSELELAYEGLKGAFSSTEPLRIVAAASHLSKPYEDLRSLVSALLQPQIRP